MRRRSFKQGPPNFIASMTKYPEYYLDSNFWIKIVFFVFFNNIRKYFSNVCKSIIPTKIDQNISLHSLVGDQKGSANKNPPFPSNQMTLPISTSQNLPFSLDRRLSLNSILSTNENPNQLDQSETRIESCRRTEQNDKFFDLVEVCSSGIFLYFFKSNTGDPL